jgi:prepilin-type N-terminal cleavage/methylation domain-containing protein
MERSLDVTQRIHPKNKARSRGFTIVEVLMSLTVLGLGILGLMTLQYTAVNANTTATQISVANAIAQTWSDRLVRDSVTWNNPSQFSANNDLANNTLWLKYASTKSGTWVAPPDTQVNGVLFSSAFDYLGRDVTLLSPQAVYCVHIMLSQVPAGNPTSGLVSATIRVFWAKHVLGNPTQMTTWGLNGALCSYGGSLATFGQDTANFNWLYTTTSISQARPQ